MDNFETSPGAGETPDGAVEDNNEAEENIPKDMDASETSPVAGNKPHGQEEDNKMKVCPLASANV
jgi:hypothetical protein